MVTADAQLFHQIVDLHRAVLGSSCRIEARRWLVSHMAVRW
jgi:hypothetical protein